MWNESILIRHYLLQALILGCMQVKAVRRYLGVTFKRTEYGSVLLLLNALAVH